MKTLTAAVALFALAAPAFATPYQEGVRDYHEGLCYRARPYPNGPENNLWGRGYEDARTKDRNKHDWSHCFPGRGRWSIKATG